MLLITCDKCGKNGLADEDSKRCAHCVEKKAKKARKKAGEAAEARAGLNGTTHTAAGGHAGGVPAAAAAVAASAAGSSAVAQPSRAEQIDGDRTKALLLKIEQDVTCSVRPQPHTSIGTPFIIGTTTLSH